MQRLGSAQSGMSGALLPRRIGTACGRPTPTGVALWAAGTGVGVLLLDPLGAAFASLWLIATIVIVRSDLDRFIIPDLASAAVAGLGLLHAVATASLEQGHGPGAIAWAVFDAVSRGAAGFAVFWLVAWAYRIRSGREGLGFGDVKLAGACAIWLDLAGQAAALEMAALAAIATVLVLRPPPGEPHAAVPFGAFLAPAAWLAFVGSPAAAALFDRYA